MKLKKMNNTLRKTEQNKPEKTAECVLSVLTPGLCFDFHPSVSCSRISVSYWLLICQLTHSMFLFVAPCSYRTPTSI